MICRLTDREAGSYSPDVKYPFLGVVALAGVLSGAPAARADDDDDHVRTLFDGRAAQDGRGIELGAILEGGGTEYAADGLTPDLQGLVIRDRNGMSARMVIGLLIAVAGAMAENGPKDVKQHTYVEGDYVVTETTTTYYSEAEKAEIRANTEKSIDGLFSAKYSDMELHLFSRDRFGRGQASGYHVNFMAGDGDTIGFETGFGFGEVDSLVESAGMPTHVAWKYLGMPFRASTVIGGRVRLALTYEWNWLKYGASKDERRIHTSADGMSQEVTAVSHPWHLDASAILLHRIQVSGGITTQQIRKPELGYYASVGFMF